jgi:hypothetical protein
VTVTPPDLPDFCWPVDWGCNAQYAADPTNADTVLMAEAMAVQTLRALTAYRVGGCPVTVRPCVRRCSPGTTLLAPVGSQGTGLAGPFIVDGAWFNSCGCRTADSCGCGTIQEIILPGPVGSVLEVKLGSVALDPSAYRVDNDTRLVRTDGEPWPGCQDMNLPAGEEGTFSITYTQGATVDGLASAAAGALAYELAQASCGGPCNLPPGVTSVVRQGTSMAIEPGSFPAGLTGIFVVDAFIRYWNPYLSTGAPDVFSPDIPRPRRQTWGA